MSDFYNLVERLTREHRVAVTTDNGVVFATEDGLLQQLRDAVFGDGGKNGGTSNKAKLPMNAPALDLLTLLDRQVAEVWAATTGRVPGTERTETLLVQWAGTVRPEMLAVISSPETVGGKVIWTKAEFAPQALLEKWERQILDLFDPPRTAEIFGPCVSCGESEVWRTSDGEPVRKTAMVFVRDRITGDSTEARCQVCGVSWLPSQFLFLAEAMGRHADSKLGMTPV